MLLDIILAVILILYANEYKAYQNRAEAEILY